MQIMLLRNNPSEYFPASIPPTLSQGKDYPYNRTGDIIRHMKDLAKGNIILIQDYEQNYVKNNPGIVFTLQGSDDYMYLWNPVDHKVSTYVLQNIYPQSPWTILSDKHGEYVKVLSVSDKYEIIDEQLNYAKLL